MKIFKIFGLILCVASLMIVFNFFKSERTLETENTPKTPNNLPSENNSAIAIVNEQYISIPGCFKSLPSDNKYSFGNVLAINDKYLAVSDSLANRVVIFTPIQDGRWKRTRVILPPKDSIPERVGSGFGSNLALDGDVLVISASTKQPKSKLFNSEDFQWQGRFSAVYKTNLTQESKVERIDTHIKGILPYSLIAADGGKIAFITTRMKPPGFLPNQVNLISDGKIDQISQQEYYWLTTWHQPSSVQYLWLKLKGLFFKVQKPELYNGVWKSRTWTKRYAYFRDIKLKNNLLLVGSTSQETNGIAWLFNLNMPKKKPQALAEADALLGDTVALSEQFAAVGRVSDRISPQGVLAKTLIKSIQNGSTKMIDGHGRLSLYKNILVRWRYGGPFPLRITDGTVTPDGLEAFLRFDHTVVPDVLEVFRLDDDATPHLILKRENIDNAKVQNGFLTTVQKIDSGVKICTESVP